MNYKTAQFYCCPMCNSELDLKVFDEITTQSTYKIIDSGVFICDKCRILYPIENGIPVFLVFNTKFHYMFERKYKSKFYDLHKYSMPFYNPEPGELKTQQVFTEQWRLSERGNLNYFFDYKDHKYWHKEVFMRWDDAMDLSVKKILNVGIGDGFESKALYDISGGKELFAIDLNFSLLKIAHSFSSYKNLHLVIASLFHLPFRDNTFDLICSLGVAHHTHSTFEAIDILKNKIRNNGYMGIWVYAAEDFFRHQNFLGYISSLRYYLLPGLRLMMSNMPALIRKVIINALGYILHPYYKKLTKHNTRWKRVNTVHALYDVFTPRFAHQHSFNEIIEWFETNFESYYLHSPLKYRKRYSRIAKGIGIVGVGKKVD